MFHARYLVFWSCVVLLAASIAALMLWGMHLGVWAVLIIAALLTVVGIIDLLQTRHAVRRNYPILAHFRYFFESIRPELRQYFFEDDAVARPFSRDQRSIVYQRAKQEIDKRPFGTQLDVYENGYEWINHSIMPAKVQPHDFRLIIGGPYCTQPYDASVFNISAMSFGALSANAVRALNHGAKLGRFAHDTGEGSISQYHREHGGDLIWEIGSGYFGCRNPDGTFSETQFTRNAQDPQVKMIELKLSQGAKPGHGGVLPGAKVTPEIAAARGVPVGQDCISPAAHSAFATPMEMMAFIAKLRTLSGGKPVGFKLAIGHPWEFFAIVKAMLASDITPDFIVVDGSEGGTGAAPVEFTDHMGVPLQEALLLVHNALVGTQLRDKIKIGAAGKIVTAFDIARTLALGADWCNSARGFMFALGCIQAQQCHTGQCPTGVTSQDPARQRALVVPDKAQRVLHFHTNTLKALAELVAAAGLTHPGQFRPQHVVRRISSSEIRLFSNLFPFLEPGALLHSSEHLHQVFRLYWPMANAHSFAPSM
jgi:glutamate synthase domain-containing protein 2